MWKTKGCLQLWIMTSFEFYCHHGPRLLGTKIVDDVIIRNFCLHGICHNNCGVWSLRGLRSS